MGNPTATLERENLSAMNAQAPELEDAERPRAAAMKFTYPTGARPLEGYTIKRGVGRGGFGEVYFAHSDAGKEVALFAEFSRTSPSKTYQYRRHHTTSHWSFGCSGCSGGGGR